MEVECVRRAGVAVGDYLHVACERHLALTLEPHFGLLSERHYPSAVHCPRAIAVGVPAFQLCAIPSSGEEVAQWDIYTLRSVEEYLYFSLVHDVGIMLSCLIAESEVYPVYRCIPAVYRQ